MIWPFSYFKKRKEEKNEQQRFEDSCAYLKKFMDAFDATNKERHDQKIRQQALRTAYFNILDEYTDQYIEEIRGELWLKLEGYVSKLNEKDDRYKKA